VTAVINAKVKNFFNENLPTTGHRNLFALD
jgi:hypothetical protein